MRHNTTFYVIDAIVTVVGFLVMYATGYIKGLKEGKQAKLDEIEEFKDDSNR